jgi:hypothetical protein
MALLSHPSRIIRVRRCLETKTPGRGLAARAGLWPINPSTAHRQEEKDEHPQSTAADPEDHRNGGVMAARRQHAGPSFDRIAELAWETREHAYRVWSLLLDVHGLRRDDVADAKKTELARLMLTTNIPAAVRHLLAGLGELNRLLAVELKPEDEKWLRRQLEGLDEGGA